MSDEMQPQSIGTSESQKVAEDAYALVNEGADLTQQTPETQLPWYRLSSMLLPMLEVMGIKPGSGEQPPPQKPPKEYDFAMTGRMRLLDEPIVPPSEDVVD